MTRHIRLTSHTGTRTVVLIRQAAPAVQRSLSAAVQHPLTLPPREISTLGSVTSGLVVASAGVNRAQAREEYLDRLCRVMGQPFDDHPHHGGE